MKIFWFDCETSGIDPEKNGIISLAYAVEIDSKIIDHGELFGNCEGKEIEDEALQVNKFTREQIAKHPAPDGMHINLLNIFNKHIDRYDKNDKFTAAGFNVGFDMGFLRQLFKDCGDTYFGSWFSFGHLDPAQIIRFLEYCGTPVPTRTKLTDLAEFYGVSSDNAHDALADIGMTIRITRAIRESLKK